jgi:hypothetical protein
MSPFGPRKQTISRLPSLDSANSLSRRSGRGSLLFICLSLLLAASRGGARTSELEVFPKHFSLHPGEQIHYQVVERAEDSQARSVDYELTIENHQIVRAIEPKGVIEAVRPGRTELVVRTPTAERRIAIEVTGRPQPPMRAVPYSAVREIRAKELLFVGHANLDGFDHTAVAKPGIDHLVQEAKKKGWPVVYFVSQTYPNWYTADRQPDYAIISEGQEHDIHIDADRVTFAGGSFMFCVLRNVQMTLHGMVKGGAQQAHFVFPAQAIWVEDLWGPGEKQPYPAPMLLLTTLFASRMGDAPAYDHVVVPFLDRVIMQFPVLAYPSPPPSPPLSDMLKDWRVVVRFGDRFERVYRRGSSNKTLLVEFQGV